MLMPTWRVPENIKALCFDKYDSAVAQKDLLPCEPQRLKQVHGQTIITLPSTLITPNGDGCYTQAYNTVCAIQTADCLAIYLTSSCQNEIALLHGGWRGLSQNILSAGLSFFQSHPRDIIAHLGPAISAPHYEVGDEVYQAFCLNNPTLTAAFMANRPGHYLCDLYKIARLQLQQLGVTQVSGGEHCTFREAERFYSVRREGQLTGRLLHCLWMEPHT